MKTGKTAEAEVPTVSSCRRSYTHRLVGFADVRREPSAIAMVGRTRRSLAHPNRRQTDVHRCRSDEVRRIAELRHAGIRLQKARKYLTWHVRCRGAASRYRPSSKVRWWCPNEAHRPVGHLTRHVPARQTGQAYDVTTSPGESNSSRRNVPTKAKSEPNFHGSTAQKEAWMRQKQANRTAKIEADRERQMLAEAESHLAQKRAVCQCTIEQLKARLRKDPGLRAMLTRGLEEC